ncbi:MAG: metallophosphoesterase [Pirellulaceae bacterium]|nr:metallophosphoesterase [Pirellulaceae bacterium]
MPRDCVLPSYLVMWCAVFSCLTQDVVSAQTGGVTMIVTSDCHYDAFENEDRNQRVRETVLEMNAIAQRSWPEQVGGGAIDRPRGVLVLGDVIDDGDRMLDGRHQTPVQYGHFLADFGLDGTDGLLKYPVFEGWGNHDGPPAGKEKHGFSFQAQLKKRNQIRQARGLIANVSENGLHYSWDWDQVHLVQLNIYPADQQREGVRYSAQWHDPQGALGFLKQDLADRVGQSGRPVVLLSHCGFDTDWWSPEDWRQVYEAVQPYRVVLYMYGHSGTGLRPWAPTADLRPLQCVNTGQTENGFFVVHIADQRLRLAYRVKTHKVTRGADNKPQFDWDGSWDWKHFLVSSPSN